MSANQLFRADTGDGTRRRGEAPVVTPRDALLEHLRAVGGQRSERQLVTEVAYGTAACRRVLEELETTGRVERREVGPETMVYAADAPPATSGPRGSNATD